MACTTCKKKKVITELEPTIIEVLPPTIDEITEAYILMQGRNVSKEDYEKINKVYEQIFNEKLPYGCSGCGQKHFRKFDHYIRYTLKLDLK